MLESCGSTSAKLGQRVFDTLRHADEVMGMAEALRNEWKVSDSSAGFLRDVNSQPSSTRVVRTKSGYSASTFKWRLRYIYSGVE